MKCLTWRTLLLRVFLWKTSPPGVPLRDQDSSFRVCLSEDSNWDPRGKTCTMNQLLREVSHLPKRREPASLCRTRRRRGTSWWRISWRSSCLRLMWRWHLCRLLRLTERTERRVVRWMIRSRSVFQGPLILWMRLKKLREGWERVEFSFCLFRL